MPKRNCRLDFKKNFQIQKKEFKSFRKYPPKNWIYFFVYVKKLKRSVKIVDLNACVDLF